MHDVWLTLDKFRVPAADKADLTAVVNSTRSDIVVGSEHAQGAAQALATDDHVLGKAFVERT